MNLGSRSSWPMPDDRLPLLRLSTTLLRTKPINLTPTTASSRVYTPQSLTTWLQSSRLGLLRHTRDTHHDGITSNSDRTTRTQSRSLTPVPIALMQPSTHQAARLSPVHPPLLWVSLSAPLKEGRNHPHGWPPLPVPLHLFPDPPTEGTLVH